jgi:tRNA nucleotidyltransferase (CCA-adding enzyme)
MPSEVSQKTSAEAGWELLPHDADVCVRGWGPTAEVAFEQAANGLTAVVTTETVDTGTELDVECANPDIELLFVEWLNAIIYEMSVQRMLFGRFKVRIEGGKLTGKLWGETIDMARHVPACEPKGATYTALSVKQNDGVWSAQCVVDV